MSDHVCELPEPSLDMSKKYSRGRSYRCPICHAEWLVVTGGEPEIATWMQHGNADEKAAKAAIVWAEIKSMARDYALAAEIRVLVHHVDHSMIHIHDAIKRLEMDDSAEALQQAWALVIQIVTPIMELEEIDGLRSTEPSSEGERCDGGEPAPARGERAPHDGNGTPVRRLRGC